MRGLLLNLPYLLLSLLFTFYQVFFVKPVSRIIFFDVGQGDSAMIQTLAGKKILIDGGPGDYLVYKLSKFLVQGDRKIDLVILTHPHLDHLSGLLDVLERFEVGEIWANTVCYDLPEYEELLKYVGRIKRVGLGVISKFDEVEVKVLHPFDGDRSEECETSTDGNVNNDSVVVEISSSKYKILMTGDAELALERELLRKRLVRDVDILKAGHHCSNSSSSSEFLDKVKPELVICSLGEGNLYGHPGKATLERLEKRGIKYLITAQEGDIVIRLS